MTTPTTMSPDPDPAPPAEHDLLIIGAGTLGREIAHLWRQQHPHAHITGETLTPFTHAALSAANITPTLPSTPTPPHAVVVFCAPPRPGVDYAASAARAAALTAPGGVCVFTSSTGVHGGATGVIDETTGVGEGRRAERLADAERAVLRVEGGRVVRLTGLYGSERGFYLGLLRGGSLSGPPDAQFNLINYWDAAHAVVKVLERGEAVEEAARQGRRVFLAAAKESASTRKVREAVMRHPEFVGRDLVLRGEGGAAVTYDSTWTRKVLGWKPRFESFGEFVDAEREAALEKKKEKVAVGEAVAC